MGNGDWGLGIGDWGLGPIPNSQSPIPICQFLFALKFINKKIFIYYLIEIKNNIKYYTNNVYLKVYQFL